MLNLALRKTALQSSVSAYSLGSTPAEDAKGANNGQITGRYGFHTETEQNPWWQVDLEDIYSVYQVVIFNRPDHAGRLKRFTLLGSCDGAAWTNLFQKTDDRVFGENGEPLIADLEERHLIRFVRVRLDGHAALHFDECQVFGEHPDAAMQSRAHQEEKQAERLRGFIRKGRQGRIAEVGGLSVFVDEENYGHSLVGSLDRGDCEGPKRRLINQLVTHVDRIIDIGTGIGIGAMTAARIAGAESVSTFDGNPKIVDDARDNFARNDLAEIRSYIGTLANRVSIAHPKEEEKGAIHCLEDMIEEYRATVLVCDLKGGEVELLPSADLSAIRLIVMEAHYWVAGEVATDEMIRQLISGGFSIHLGFSRMQHVALRKHKPR